MANAMKELEEAAAEAVGYLKDLGNSDSRWSGAKACAKRIEDALRDLEESRHQGHLQKQAGGRWAILREGFAPDEITSGETIRLEVDGKPGLQLTRIEHRQPDGYYSVEGYALKDGLRAARLGR